MKNINTDNSTKSKIKIFVVGIILIATAIYAFTTYMHYKNGLTNQKSQNRPFSPNNPPPNFSNNPSSQDRKQFREQMAKDLNLTPEQQKKIEELEKQGRPSNPEEGRKRMEQMQSILTKEQQQKMQSNMQQNMQRRNNPFMSRQLERAEKLLSQDQYELYKKKLEERRSRGPGPGGMPPGGMPGRQNQPQDKKAEL